MNFWDRELEDVLYGERLRQARRHHRRCQEKGCVRAGTRLERDCGGQERRFCQGHGKARAEHNRIVARILDIPPRD